MSDIDVEAVDFGEKKRKAMGINSSKSEGNEEVEKTGYHSKEDERDGGTIPNTAGECGSTNSAEELQLNLNIDNKTVTSDLSSLTQKTNLTTSKTSAVVINHPAASYLRSKSYDDSLRTDDPVQTLLDLARNAKNGLQIQQDKPSFTLEECPPEPSRDMLHPAILKSSPQENPCMDRARAPSATVYDELETTSALEEGKYKMSAEALQWSKGMRVPVEGDCLVTCSENVQGIKAGFDSCVAIDRLVDRRTANIVEKKIGSEWKKLAWELSLSESDVDAIDKNQSNYDSEEKTHAVLQKWQHRRSIMATVEDLAFHLQAIDRNDLAEEILNPPSHLLTSRASSSSLSTSASQLEISDLIERSRVLKKVQTSLKEDYKALEMKGLPWMKDIVLKLDEYYVNLEMKIEGKGSAEKMNIEELFDSTKERENPSRILIEGGPGSGKTTLAGKLAYDWANDQTYVSHFDLVLLLPVRLFLDKWNDTLAMAVSLVGNERKQFLRLVNEELISILFILDGYDEASAQTEKEVLPLIKKELYGKSSVIVTSRPGRFTSHSRDATERKFLAESDVAPVCNRFIEKRVVIKGFSERQQKMFIDKHMEKFDELQKERVTLKFAKMVDKEFLTCPLFLLMLIVVFTSDEDVENTDTITGLYKHVFNLVFRRYYSKLGETSVDHLDLFSFESGNRPNYIKLMIQFSELALEALSSNKMTISKEEIEKTYSPELLDIGFLTQYVSIKGFRESVLYEPVHKSLLEFASAYGLCMANTDTQQLPSPEEVILFRPGKTSSLFFPFLVGLMGEKAGILFDIISPYAFEYSCKFESLHRSLLETSVNESILASLIPFLPPEWIVTCNESAQKIGFFSSPQHKEIVSWGMKEGKISQICWDLSHDACFPTNMEVDTLVLDMKQFENINDFSDTLSRNTHYSGWCSLHNKLRCKYLWCSFRSSVRETDVNLKGFWDFLESIEFEFISFHFAELIVREDQDVLQKNNHELLPYIYNTVTRENFRILKLYSVTAEMCHDASVWIRAMNGLIKLNMLKSLEIHVSTATQADVDSLVTNLAKSTNLTSIAFSLKAEEATLTVNLALLCNGGKKKWKNVEFFGVKIEGAGLDDVPFVFQHIDLTSCSLSDSVTNLIRHCRVRSLHCSALMVADTRSKWPHHESLTELNLAVDHPFMYRGLYSVTETLPTLQILALTMTSFQHSFSLKPTEWISNALSVLRLKGIEIWKFSKNAALATDLVTCIVHSLEQTLSVPEEQHRLVNSNTNGVRLQYLMINDAETETGHSAANCLQKVKNCLRFKCLQRLELVFSKESRFSEYCQFASIFSEYSIKKNFPHEEGFKVEHDLWGSRQDDSIYSKTKHRTNLAQKDRITITLGL